MQFLRRRFRLALQKKAPQILLGVLVILKADQILEIVDSERGLDLRLTLRILRGIHLVAEVRGVETTPDEQLRSGRRQTEVALEQRIK